MLNDIALRRRALLAVLPASALAFKANATCFGETMQDTPDGIELHGARQELQARPERYTFGDARLFRIMAGQQLAGWVYGTFHSGHPLATAIGSELFTALSQAKVVAVESNSTDKAALSDSAAAREWAGTVTRPLGVERARELNTQSGGTFFRDAQQAGIADYELATTSPFQVQARLENTGCASAIMRAFRTGVSADDLLAGWAAVSGRSVLSLESPFDSLTMAFGEQSRTEITSLLPLFARRARLAAEFFNAQLQLYASGRTALVAALQLTFLTTSAERDTLEARRERLVVRRTAKFVEGLSTKLSAETQTLMAVGASHLVGSEGLLAGLARLGFSPIPAAV